MDMNYRGGMWEGGGGRMEWSEGGGKWDNCNSIINKYIKKIKLLVKSEKCALYFMNYTIFWATPI